MSDQPERKPRLTVFLGAGAAAALGVPGTPTVTQMILASDEAHRRGATPVFDFVQKLIAERYDHNANFEHILHTLECLENYYHSVVRGHSPYFGVKAGAIEWTLAAKLYLQPETELSSAWSVDRLGIDLRSVDIAIDSLYKELRKIFGPAHRTASGHSKWPAFVDFWKRLKGEYFLDIVTTNYDRCAEEGLLAGGNPEPEHGFVKDTHYPQYGVFDGRRLNRGDGDRILHLHGSVQFSDRGVREDQRGLYNQDRLSTDQLMWWDTAELDSELLLPGDVTLSQAGENLRVGPMITGLRKPEKLLAAEPYTTYYRLLSQCMQTNHRLLIIGYGFGDLHINSLFMRMKHWHAQDRRIVCLSYMPSQALGQQELPEWYNARTGMQTFKWLSGVHDKGSTEFFRKDDSRIRAWNDNFMLRATGFLAEDDPAQVDEVLEFLRPAPLSADYVRCEPRTIRRSLR